MVGPSSPEEEVDALRRRLYRPGATETDRQRYVSAVRSTARPDPSPTGPAREDPIPPPARPRGRVAVAVAGAALVAVVAAALLAAGGGRTRPAEPPPARTKVAVAQPDRDGFVHALGAGRDAGLARYFYAHPQSIPAALHAATRADTEEYRGTGTATLPLDPSSLSYDGGHVTLVLVTESPAAVRWRITRIDTRRDWTSYPRTLGHGAATQQAGVPVPSTVAYTGAPPMHVRVQAPADVRWGAIVVISD